MIVAYLLLCLLKNTFAYDFHESIDKNLEVFGSEVNQTQVIQGVFICEDDDLPDNEGTKLRKTEDTNIEGCKESCIKSPSCNALAMDRNYQKCYLKTNFDKAKSTFGQKNSLSNGYTFCYASSGDVTTEAATEAASSGGNLIFNGNFESCTCNTNSYLYIDDPQLSGWQIIDTAVLIKSGNPSWGSAPSVQGSYFLGLQSNGVFDRAIMQNVSGLVPGTIYELEWYERIRSEPYLNRNLEVVADGGVTIFPLHQVAKHWTHMTAAFVATKQTMRIKFKAPAGPGDGTVFLDSISIQPNDCPPNVIKKQDPTTGKESSAWGSNYGTIFQGSKAIVFHGTNYFCTTWWSNGNGVWEHDSIPTDKLPNDATTWFALTDHQGLVYDMYRDCNACV